MCFGLHAYFVDIRPQYTAQRNLFPGRGLRIRRILATDVRKTRLKLRRSTMLCLAYSGLWGLMAK